MFKKKMQNLKKDQRGLTLVELLAVVVILAIVAAIAFVVIGNVIDNSKKDAQVANAQQLIASAKLYEATNTGESMKKVTVDELQKADALGDLLDPWKGKSPSYGDDGEVTKTKDEETGKATYTVILAGAECTIDGKNEKQLNEEGRKACGPGNATSGD